MATAPTTLRGRLRRRWRIATWFFGPALLREPSDKPGQYSTANCPSAPGYSGAGGVARSMPHERRCWMGGQGAGILVYSPHG